jgi:hypothetical protein
MHFMDEDRAMRSSAHDFVRMAALAGVRCHGSIFHTKITRSRPLRLQRDDLEGLVAPARYIRFPSPAPKPTSTPGTMTIDYS